MKKMFQKRMATEAGSSVTFQGLETLQVNLGDMCNLSCAHCHHHASPRGSRIMGREVMAKIETFLARNPGLTLDITGGCPEMNPHFRTFVENTAGLAARRIIRSNLAIALEPGMEWLPDFYREQGLVVMASLPCYETANVERQRGDGVFDRSIEVLRQLNRQGYGTTLELHLVHNPGNGAVAGSRAVLEEHYRRELLQQFGVSFSRLHCMNNTPLGRFREALKRKGSYDRYLEHLATRFNPEAAGRVMCRTLLSVGWDGGLYNCDFNLAAGLPLKGRDGAPVTMDGIDQVRAGGCEIVTGDHCFSCTAGEGSGCGGSLAGPAPGPRLSADGYHQDVALCSLQ